MVEGGVIAKARELGRSEPLPLTEDLLAAINADLERQASKAEQP